MMMNRQLYAALASWMDFVADKKHMRTAGGRVMRLMMNRQLHGAFSGWAESVAEQLYLRDEDRRRESVRHLYSLGSKTDASCSVTQSRARLLLLILARSISTSACVLLPLHANGRADADAVRSIRSKQSARTPRRSSIRCASSY
jgi:hypothetical protein